MNHESYQDELTRVRHAMDDSEDETERECLRKEWLRLREAERQQQPLKVQQLEGLCSVQQVVDAYGGFDAMYEYWVAEHRERKAA